MATYNVQRAKHATLVAATVDTVNFSMTGDAVRIVNRATAGDIYFTVDGTVPTSLGDDTYVLNPSNTVTIDASRIDAVKLISAGTPAYSVELW